MTEQQVIDIFRSMGLDPSIHFDGTVEPGRAARLAASGMTEAELKAILGNAPQLQETSVSQLTEQEVINIFQQLGQDPNIHFDGTREPGRAARLAASGITEAKLRETLATAPKVPLATGVLQGGELIKVLTSAGDRYYQIYEFPLGSGQFISFQYDNFEQVEAVLGKAPAHTIRNESWFNQNVLAEAAIGEVVGRGGSWQGYTEELMHDAAVAAGIRDPSLIGLIASDPEMQAIMALAVAGDWTPAQILAEQRNTNFWKNVLYPGIEAFYGKTSNPETAWIQYTASVTGALRQLGYTPDADGTFNSQIKDMLDKGIDAQTFLGQVPTFLLATQNSEFAAILNEWTQRDLGIEVGFQEWFDLLAGNSSIEIEQVAENARLAWVAQNQGTDLSNEEIAALALRTDLTAQEAAAAFSEVNLAMLALGPSGLARGGLTRDDIVSMAAGIAPQSGNIDEVRLKVAKLARENDLFDNEKINFFVGFDPLGRPNRPGLQALSPEGA